MGWLLGLAPLDCLFLALDPLLAPPACVTMRRLPTTYAIGTASAALATAAEAALWAEAVRELTGQMWASSSVRPRVVSEQL